MSVGEMHMFAYEDASIFEKFPFDCVNHDVIMYVISQGASISWKSASVSSHCAE